MPSRPLFIRELWYRDETGRYVSVRIETADFAELDRVASLYADIEARHQRKAARWDGHHATFTDSGVDLRVVAVAPAGKDNPNGFPWEGDRFAFAYLLGESAVWSGPDSLWVTPDEGKTWSCRFCGHLKALPLTAACLNADCARTGRDMAIERVTAYDLRRREEPKPVQTKLPPPRKDRAGRELAGGLGKRSA